MFVSYSRSDVGYVNRLADTLTRAGLSIWKDDRNLEIGDRWEHEVRDRVDDCAAMVIVMSPAAEASMNVANELARARDRGKAIFPVLLSGEVWFALSTINYFDARDRRLPDQRLIDKLQHLGTAVEGRTDPGPMLLAGDLPGQAIAWQHRPGLLDALVTSAAGGGTTVVAALAGQRGVGKTQLAAAYARLRMQHGWPVIVWANAGSEQGIITALDELADAARLRQLGDDPTEATRAALRWLRRHRPRPPIPDLPQIHLGDRRHAHREATAPYRRRPVSARSGRSGAARSRRPLRGFGRYTSAAPAGPAGGTRPGGSRLHPAERSYPDEHD
uniref:toll/interleukin-1 receptor domain-containing protein n=1 Tax=Paractinoplanes polyasparticus TaxID=2856853 RepID=UPI001C85612B|nr:toll/interleukin-1 receptor domain-containing protein [Actinoplanes polyasparticus]